ncbi:MAG: hypothetical protein J2P50_08895, partial [Hyphomicrobiaceae bacterium]|nr:hypothetical protein [Hyphomicrobiaceae bacterium]
EQGVNPVRVLLTATMATSVLAIGLNMEPAQSLPLGAASTSPDAAAAVLKAQGKEMSPGANQSQGGGGQAAPGQSSPGKGMTGPGQGGPSMGGPGGAGSGKMRGEGQYRSGEQGGAYGYGPRERSREERMGREGDRGQMRRHFSRRGWETGPTFGYLRADCGWLRRRALATGSRYWWRQYRDCLR